MQAVCPITEKRINENVARLNGVATVLLIALFIILNYWGGMLFLMIDFITRGFIDNRFSLICQLNKWIVERFKLGGKIINAGPKIFAAQVGALLSTLALGTHLLGYANIALVFASILGFFSFLEAAFGFCVACKLYPLVRKWL